MEQEDYFLREIEKIGIILRSLINSLTGNNENLAITISNNFETTNEKLINETGFDLTKFLALEEPASGDYISGFKGINTENLELLAKIIFLLGINDKSDKKKILLNKALNLYESCNLADKTYSPDRENKISEINNFLK